MTAALMDAETKHQCTIRVTKDFRVIVESNDGHVCDAARREAARLNDAGYRVALKIDGMSRPNGVGG